MGCGVAFGVVAPRWTPALQPINTVFFRLLKSAIGPLLFGSIVTSVAAAATERSMGRIAMRALICFEIMTTVAIIVGVGIATVTEIGIGIKAPQLRPSQELIHAGNVVSNLVDKMIPVSIADALARNDFLQIVVFATILGVACAASPTKSVPVVKFFDGLTHVMLHYTGLIMWLAPFAVASAIALTISSNGVVALLHLGRLVIAMMLGVVVWIAFVLLPTLKMTRLPVLRFIGAVREPVAIGLCTASSEAALPIALVSMRRMGVPERIADFVLPVGYSLNLVGSALYLSIACNFLAQAAGIRLDMKRELYLIATLMLMSKGMAGVPRASFVVLVATLPLFGLPTEGLSMLLSVDVLLDMIRTGLNVCGNCLTAAVVARWEGVSFDDVEDCAE